MFFNNPLVGFGCLNVTIKNSCLVNWQIPEIDYESSVGCGGLNLLQSIPEKINY
jgi:hypothetical protein